MLIFFYFPSGGYSQRSAKAVPSGSSFTEQSDYDSSGARLRARLREYDSSKVELIEEFDSSEEEIIHKKIEKLDIDLTRVERADKKLEKYFSDPEFLYDRTGEMPLSFWDKIKLWINQKLMELFSSEGYSVILDYLGYILIAFAVIMIILGLFKKDIRGFISRKPAESVSGLRETEEDINRLDLDKLIDEALGKKEFRIATRLLYLKSLKYLSDNDFINWQINKTNKNYIQELKEPALKNSFIKITNLFEFIWYGEFNLNDPEFASVARSFKDFNSRFTGS